MDREQEALEAELENYARVIAGRDSLIVRARRAGITKNRIHKVTGISRSTIDRVLDKEFPMYTCDICGFKSRRPLIEGPLGTCYRCPARTRHIAATDGPLPGHALCEAIAVYDGQGRDDAPACPVCVHAQETGVDPLRHRDMVLLGYVITVAPELWEAGGHEHLLWETERGRRLVRDGYLVDRGETFEATDSGRALCEAYEEAWRGDRQANANHSVAIAMGLRAVEPARG